MHSDFVSLSVHFLYGGVIGVFVGDKECCLDITAVWIAAFAVEYFLVEANVVVINGIVECDGDHLGHVFVW